MKYILIACLFLVACAQTQTDSASRVDDNWVVCYRTFSFDRVEYQEEYGFIYTEDTVFDCSDGSPDRKAYRACFDGICLEGEEARTEIFKIRKRERALKTAQSKAYSNN